MDPQNTPSVWPPASDPAPPTPSGPPPRAGRGQAADMLLYALVWTLVALVSLASVVVMVGGSGVLGPVGVRGPVMNWSAWLDTIMVAALLLFIIPPISIAWLLCMVAFSLTHLGWLRRLGRGKPPGGVEVRSLRLGALAGLVQAVLVVALSYLLRLPLGLHDPTSQTLATGQAVTLALPAYGFSPWLGSLIAGGAVGSLWARRAARVL